MSTPSESRWAMWTAFFIIAILVYGLYRLAKQPSRKSDTQSTPPPIPPVVAAPDQCGPGHQAEVPLKEVLPEDESWASLAVEAARRVEAEAAPQISAQRQAITDAQQKLARAKSVLQEGKLWWAVPRLFNTVRYWPSWSKKPSLDWKTPINVIELDGGDREVSEPNRTARQSRWVQFRYDGSLLEFGLVEDGRSYFGDGCTVTAKLTLRCNGAEVLVLDVSKDISKEYDDWGASGVSAFLPGPWMPVVAELNARLELHTQQERQSRELDLYGSKASKVVLDD